VQGQRRGTRSQLCQLLGTPSGANPIIGSRVSIGQGLQVAAAGLLKLAMDRVLQATTNEASPQTDEVCAYPNSCGFPVDVSGLRPSPASPCMGMTGVTRIVFFANRADAKVQR
jgi:hypothetical protein